MDKRVDEKILDFINEVEKRKARKDIRNGPIKIGERYYETEHGSEIAMVPDALIISGVSEKNISISFKDKVGVHIKSPKKLKINADEEIVMRTPKRVKIKAHSQILMMKRNGSHSISMEDEVILKEMM